MKILVIGSGGREHALVWKIAQDDRVEKIYCAPGNPGMKDVELMKIETTDIESLITAVKTENIDFTVVGPEQPLVNGIVDSFESEGLKIFGPSAAAAQLEGSKYFAKRFMERYSIPTSNYAYFDNAEEALQYINQETIPCVVKASGLAAGKGAVICNKIEDAKDCIDSMMIRKDFGKSGDMVLIEELMIGEEASILAISDGENYVILPSSQDHKRVCDNDEGPNTGGMGAYSPAPVITEEMLSEIESKIIKPTIHGMAQDGIPFKGVLYAGVMVTSDGPKVVEFNVRFGDPEAQVVIPLLDDEFLDLLIDSAAGDISQYSSVDPSRHASCVVLASKGYPGEYETGHKISGLENDLNNDVMIFHAGTILDKEEYYTNGGRVLSISGIGSTLIETLDMVYDTVDRISFEGVHYRTDIGQRGLKYQEVVAG
ncbi:MAG: phosphoribosylamine--glycine ligase [Candidatus Marinimicrobia bacterium]|nr:phosphoribosylamine--glycine ligase [Candidatus Neomarinimicrobiota bacterium]